MAKQPTVFRRRLKGLHYVPRVIVTDKKLRRGTAPDSSQG
jgi:hypothetical protein